MENKKILITGGAGFIGSYLVERLAENNEIIVVDTLLRGNKIPKSALEMPNVQLYNIDVRDENKLLPLGKGVDCIFHLAAILGVDIVADNPVETMQTEVLGTMNVAECAIQHNVPKIVYASTSGVYGHNALERSVTEEVQIDPCTSYAMAKRYNEIYLGALNEEKGISAISLRYFNVYGPRQDNRMVIPRFLEQSLKGLPITVFGDGEQSRDFTWIDDTVSATIKAASGIEGFEILNVANDTEYKIRELAEKIKILTHSHSEIQFIRVPSKRYDYEVGRRIGSSTKLERLVGFKPRTRLDTGLRKVISYYRNIVHTSRTPKASNVNGLRN